MMTDAILRKINLGHNFDDILALLEDLNELDQRIVARFRSQTAQYLGFQDSLGFAFHLVAESDLPFPVDHLIKTDQVVDWLSLRLNQFLEKITLNTEPYELSESLEDFVCDALRQYKLKEKYEDKLVINHKFIMGAFREYKALITDMIDMLIELN